MANSGLLCGFIARLNDDCLASTQPFFREKTGYLAALFPFCACLDVGFQTAKNIKHRLIQRWTGQDLSKEIQRTHELAERCLLGAVFSPLSFLCHDLVTQHLIHRPTLPHVVTPYGKFSSIEAEVVHPKTFADIQAVFIRAKAEGKKVSIAGAMMSQGKQALPSVSGGIIINMDQFNSIAVHPETKTATIGAGATFEMIQDEANKYKLAVKVAQASNVFSLGGALSINCHGWDPVGSIGQTVRSITAVLPNGEIVNVTRENELFGYLISGMGLFGVIIYVELELADNLVLDEIGTHIHLDTYTSYFKQEVITNQATKLHYCRLSLNPKKLFGEAVAVSYNDRKHTASNEPLLAEPPHGRKIERIELHILRRFDSIRQFVWMLERRTALFTKRLTRNTIMRPPIKSVENNSLIDSEWLQEFFVPEEELDAFVPYLASVLSANKVRLYNASIRYVKQDTVSKLGYATQGNLFAFVIFFNQKLDLEEIKKTKMWVQPVNDYVLSVGGTFYLPYQPFATEDQLRRGYPAWFSEHTWRMKARVDPDNLLSTGFSQQYFGV